MPEDVNVYTFPGGKLRTLTIAVTAGNVDVDLSPGVGFRWVFLYGRIDVVADANAANRTLRHSVRNAAGNLKSPVLATATAITASQSVGWGLINVDLGDIGTQMVTADRNVILINWLVEGTDLVRLQLNAGLAGDAWEGNITVLEMKL